MRASPRTSRHTSRSAIGAGQSKAIEPRELDPDAGKQLVAIVRAQASTEFAHRGFFRRRGEFAFAMIGSDGRRFDDPEACLGHARERIPEAYRDSLDFSRWAKRQRQRRGRDLPVKDEMKSAPHLWRVGGAYPCSNSVRRVAEVSSTAQSG